MSVGSALFSLEEGAQMGEVNKEEMRQWVEAMFSLDKEYSRLCMNTVIQLPLEKLIEAKELAVKVEFPTLFKKLGEMPTPKVGKCLQSRNNFIRGIDAQRVAWAIDNEYGLGTLATSDWQSKSQGYLKKVWKDVFSLAEKYHIYGNDEDIGPPQSS